MGIILKILMVLGILILILLGIVLLALIIILAIPIRYKANVCAENGQVYVEAAVSWMRFVRIPVSFKNNKMDYSVRIFGKQIFPKEEIGAKATFAEKSGKDYETDINNQKENSSQVNNNVPEDNASIVQDTMQDTMQDETGDFGKKEGFEETAEKSGIKEDFLTKIEKILEKLQSVLKICEQEKQEVDRFFKRKSTKYTLDVLKKDILKLLNHIRPRKLSGNAEFGFDDPSVTGYVLAALSVFYGFYCENLDITPDFTGKVFNGKLFFSGRVVLGYLVYIVLDVYLRKQVRMFLKNVMGLKDVTLENIDNIKNCFISGDTV
ncbi:MAG: DUF2953 domain-containing protein [Lachnospiraceae bacterium]